MAGRESSTACAVELMAADVRRRGTAVERHRGRDVCPVLRSISLVFSGDSAGTVLVDNVGLDHDQAAAPEDLDGLWRAQPSPARFGSD
jgi:hypothetical protein